MIKAKDRARVVKYIKKAAEIQEALNDCKKNNNEKEYSKLIAKQEALKDKFRSVGATDKFINSTFRLLKKSTKFSSLMVKTFEIKPTKREKLYSVELIMLWKRCAINKENHSKLIRFMKSIATLNAIIKGLEKNERFREALDPIRDRLMSYKDKLKDIGATERFIDKTFSLLKEDPRYCTDIIDLIKKGANVKLN